MAEVITIEGAQPAQEGPGQGPGLLGLCAESDCLVGAALVKQMLEVYNAMGAPAQYRLAVEAVASRWRMVESSVGRRALPILPLRPACCEIRRLGEQAQSVTLGMVKDGGRLPPSPPIESTFDRFFKWSMIVGSAFTAAVVVLKAIELRRGPR